MKIHIEIPDINLREDELKLLLAIKLLEDKIVSLGKAAEIAGYSTKAFSEILIHRGVPPIRYEDIDLEKELENAEGSSS
jgi:predicted HTH domain antitoxin